MARKNSMVLGSVCLVAGAAFGAATPAQADVIFFLDAGEFEAALAAAGKTMKGFENFPWLAAGGSVIGADDPLDTNSSVGGWLEPGMLLDNLTYQANIGGADSSQPLPHTPNFPGESGLALFTTGFVGAMADGIVANYFVDAFDIVSGPPAGDNHTAMALNVVTLLGGSTVDVAVYDKNNVLLGSISSVSAPIGGGFLGILATGGDTLGRINIFDPVGGAEGVYDIAVYVPAPGCLALLGLAGLAGTRRRRA